MGLVAGSSEHQKLHARRVVTEAVETQRGAKRGQAQPSDRTDLQLRGIPVVGIGGGVIPGTRPGDSAAALERAGRDIVRARLTRNRFKAAT